MPVRRHHLLLTAVLPGLLLTGPAANATCVGAADHSVCALDTPGSVEGSYEPGDGSGPCLYEKTSSPPPSDWQGAEDSPPPYFFWRTQTWGESAEHPRWTDWDYHVCLLICADPLDPTTCSIPRGE